MSSAIDTAFAASVPDQLADFGEDVTYKPLGSTPNQKTIKAIVHDETRNNRNAGNTAQSFDQLEISISARSDAEGQISVTNAHDGVCDQVASLRSKSWYVIDILQNNVAGMHRLLLRDSLVLHAGEG
jgi:hypothetical protein